MKTCSMNSDPPWLGDICTLHSGTRGWKMFFSLFFMMQDCYFSHKCNYEAALAQSKKPPKQAWWACVCECVCGGVCVSWAAPYWLHKHIALRTETADVSLWTISSSYATVVHVCVCVVKETGIKNRSLWMCEAQKLYRHVTNRWQDMWDMEGKSSCSHLYIEGHQVSVCADPVISYFVMTFWSCEDNLLYSVSVLATKTRFWG